MSVHTFSTLIEEIGKRHTMVQAYLFDEKNSLSFEYNHLEDAVYSYIKAGGKSLRSAVMMFSCGAVGGDEKTALPAAAAIELYHTFTLVHDDIIDRDVIRRGVPTVHHEFTQRATNELGFDEATAAHYGLAIAILTGDLQQGWAASLLPDLHHTYGLPAELPLNLISELFNRTQVTLINGETIDVTQSQTPIEQLSEDEVLKMLSQKTGVLYEFAGRAGAAIGLRTADLHHPTVEAVASFTGKCGIAFQLQDDILGVVGNEKKTGKAVGADIREGKRTVIVLNSFKKMTDAQREFALNVLGNAEATDDQIQEVTHLLQSTGGIDHAKNLSKQLVQEARDGIAFLDDTPYKNLLLSWSDYIVERDL